MLPVAHEAHLISFESVHILLRRVRWYVFVEGNEVDLHNAHWHGNVLLRDGHRVDQCATCNLNICLRMLKASSGHSDACSLELSDF